MLARGRAIPPSSPSDDELVRLQARIDQTLAIVADAARRNSANRDLVDVCLDVANALRPPAKPSPRSR